jgi:hypothetical protein
MLKRLFLAVALACLSLSAAADTLPLPDNLVALDTKAGASLFMEAEAHTAFFPLGSQFVTQQNPAFCGVASMVMVLNALKVKAPERKLDRPLPPGMVIGAAFDQENFFNEATEAVRPRAAIEQRGMTLDQLGGLAGTFGLTVEVHHAADTDLDAFRKAASEALAAPDRYVLVNYLRSAIGQKSWGHISPLAAYDAESDRFLILDVARYNYPPVWVRAPELFAAMNTPDSDNDNRSRGFVMVSR